MATTINWTDILPVLPTDYLYGGFSESQQDGLIQTSMSEGDIKVRRRFTSYVEDYSGYMIMSTTQKTAFQAFYRETLGFGCLSFNFPNPVSIGNIEVRFTSIPKVSASSHDDWKISFSIEEIS